MVRKVLDSPRRQALNQGPRSHGESDRGAYPPLARLEKLLFQQPSLSWHPSGRLPANLTARRPVWLTVRVLDALPRVPKPIRVSGRLPRSHAQVAGPQSQSGRLPLRTWVKPLRSGQTDLEQLAGLGEKSQVAPTNGTRLSVSRFA